MLTCSGRDLPFSSFFVLFLIHYGREKINRFCPVNVADVNGKLDKWKHTLWKQVKVSEWKCVSYSLLVESSNTQWVNRRWWLSPVNSSLLLLSYSGDRNCSYNSNICCQMVGLLYCKKTIETWGVENNLANTLYWVDHIQITVCPSNIKCTRWCLTHHNNSFIQNGSNLAFFLFIHCSRSK